MLSIYRGENLPPESHFLMTILEMLFQWYILKQSILEDDYKSLGLSLKSNLQETHEEQQVSNFSIRMSQNSRVQSIVRIHNHQSLSQISSRKFISDLNQRNEYHDLYIGYMQVIGEALCKISQSKQKIIRRSKLQVWLESYISKMTQCLKQARG